MEIKIDNVAVKTLTEFEVKVLIDRVYEGTVDTTVTDLLVNKADLLYAERIGFLKDAWLPKLIADGLQSVPTNSEAAVQLIFDSDTYKNAKTARDNK